MKIKVYAVYINNKRDTMFLTRRSAKEYLEYLSFYCLDNDTYYYRKEYIYV